jgi:hypothetical protein
MLTQSFSQQNDSMSHDNRTANPEAVGSALYVM